MSARGDLSSVWLCLLVWDLKISLLKPDVPPAHLGCRGARLTARLPASLTALWLSQFGEYKETPLCLGRPCAAPLWTVAEHASERVFGTWDVCEGTDEHGWHYKKKSWKEMNKLCLRLNVFGPSGKDFLPCSLSSLPFKHTFSLFCLYLTSPVPLICCTSLSLSLPVYPPWCKVVILFHLSLLSFTFLSILVIISPPCPLVTPPVIHLSASM